MKKLLPIILLLLGAGGGIGAGLFLRPPPPAPDAAASAPCPANDTTCTPAANTPAAAVPPDGAPAAASPAADTQAAPAPNSASSTGAAVSEFVALQRQMIVPIVSDSKVISLVVLSLSIEVQAGHSNEVYDREPKLRDAFLQTLFRHANTGGFNGDFTSGEKMADLRRALNTAAAQVLGPVVIQVLVTDIMRQAT